MSRDASKQKYVDLDIIEKAQSMVRCGHGDGRARPHDLRRELPPEQRSPRSSHWEDGMNAPVIVFGRARVIDLVRKVSALTGIPEVSLTAKSRDEDARVARFAIMRVALESGRSLMQIARVLGGMHHTSVAHGIFRSRQIEKTDAEFAELLRLLREETPHASCPCCGQDIPSLRADVDKPVSSVVAPAWSGA
jgi:hypothetical protein